MRLALEEIINCIDGKLYQDFNENIEITGISTDTRSIKKSDLFIPLKGYKFDGHSFIKGAEKSGAIAALWHKSMPIPQNINIPLIIVSDTLLSLQKLAKYYREKINPKIVGVTGSNGKTTTKDLISAILSSEFNVHKTKGNLNNHIGVPLTLLSMSETTEVAVIEMGMSDLGEIEVLSQIAQPDIVVITNIGESHLEYLKNRENIAKAKLEILTGLKENGWAIFNGDEPLIRKQLSEINRPFKLHWVGMNKRNDVYPLAINFQDMDQTNFVDNEHNEYFMPLLGSHNVHNALIAIEVGKVLGVPYNQIEIGLSNLQLTGMRLEKIKANNGSMILNDAYNASPSSMKANLQLLSSFERYNQKIAVLGDMLELGEAEEEYHRKIGQFCAELGIDQLITTGKLGKWIADGAKIYGMKEKNVYHIDNIDEIPKLILQHSGPDTVILVKGSRGIKLEKVVEKLV